MPLILLGALVLQLFSAQNIVRRPEALLFAENLERFEVPSRPFENFDALPELDEAVVFTNLKKNNDAVLWPAWEKWKIDNLLRVDDYFSSVQVHGVRATISSQETENSVMQSGNGSGSTFFDPDKTTLLNMSGINPNVYHQRTVKEFFTCNEHNYIPGGVHPTFEPDVRPREIFKFPKNRYVTHTNLYWACQGTNTYSHYDRESVFLVQISGSKHLLLNPPSELHAMQLQPALHPSLRQSAMPLSPCQPALNPRKWPSIHRMKKYALIELNAGEALYLPPLWFHSVCNLTPSTAVSFKGTLPVLNTENLLWDIASKMCTATKNIINRMREYLKSETEEAKSTAVVFHLLDTFMLVLRRKMPKAWFSQNWQHGTTWKKVSPDPFEHPYAAFTTESLVIEVWIRYLPHQGKFLNDNAINVDCDDLKPWDKRNHAPTLLRKVVRKLRKAFSHSSLDPAYMALTFLGRYGTENEAQDLVEMALSEFVGPARTNSALRAIATCLTDRSSHNDNQDELHQAGDGNLEIRMNDEL